MINSQIVNENIFTVQLTADLTTGEVQAVQLGQNSSAIDGVEMIKDRVYIMTPTSTLHVLTGCFPQKLDIKKLKVRREILFFVTM
jgi:hypothetical protein